MTQGWTLRSTEQVQVSGSERLGTEAVVEAAQLRFPLSLLSLQPSDMENRLVKTLPVQAAVVQRRLLPPGLTVQLEDRRPLAAARRQSSTGVEQGMRQPRPVDGPHRCGPWRRTRDQHSGDRLDPASASLSRSC